MQRTKRISPCDDIELDDTHHPTACPNCGADREGPYCHECGQRYLRARLSIRELWWIFVDRFLDWEQGVWPTFTKMVTSPGILIREYLGGRRRKYLNPFSYLIICVALYAIVQSVLRKAGAVTTLSGLEVQQLASTVNAFENQSNLLVYGTVIGIGLVGSATRVMFEGRLLNITESLVTALYAAGNVFLFSVLVSVGVFVGAGQPLDTRALLITFGILFPLCMAHAGYGLFDSWGMAGFMGLAPVAASLIGVLVGFVGMFVVTIAGMDSSIVFGMGGFIGGVAVLVGLLTLLMEWIG